MKVDYEGSFYIKVGRKYLKTDIDTAYIENLQKENAELEARLEKLTIHDTNAVLKGLEMKVLKDSHRDRANKTQDQLTKAKELLKTYKDFIEYEGLSTRLGKTYDKTEQFLKEK